MRLLIIGCEYVGKTALARRISDWMIEAMGLSFVRWHNHFVVPRLDRHLIVHDEGNETAIGKNDSDLNTAEDEQQILSLRPSVLEQLQRHNIWRHLHADLFRDDDTLFINHYYAEAIYAPLYYGYGEPGSFADRPGRARAWDGELLLQAPEMVLVLVEASSDVIRERMNREPRPMLHLQDRDVGGVVRRFREEYDASLIPSKFTLETTDMDSDETLKAFVQQIQPFLSDLDRRRLGDS
jgi:hypothetical protein